MVLWGENLADPVQKPTFVSPRSSLQVLETLRDVNINRLSIPQDLSVEGESEDGAAPVNVFCCSTFVLFCGMQILGKQEQHCILNEFLEFVPALGGDDFDLTLAQVFDHLLVEVVVAAVTKRLFEALICGVCETA